VGVGDGAVADVAAAGRTNLPMIRANDTIATARPRWARTDRGPISVRRRDALARRADAAVARRWPVRRAPTKFPPPVVDM